MIGLFNQVLYKYNVKTLTNTPMTTIRACNNGLRPLAIIPSINGMLKFCIGYIPAHITGTRATLVNKTGKECNQNRKNLYVHCKPIPCNDYKDLSV